MGGPRVRRLVERDIERAIQLTDLEGWGYTRADFERLLALSPRGCFALEHAGRVLGLLTTTSYGKLAFLGAVILHPSVRGRGLGKALMDAALEHLRSAGVETVRLNAYLNVVAFYEKLGFRPEYDVIRWRCQGPGIQEEKATILRRWSASHLAAFDAEFFGAARPRLLARLAKEFPDTFFVAGSPDQILGYLVASPYDGQCEVGPWVVAPGHPEVARDLFRALRNAAGVREYAFSGPQPNSALLRFTEDAGFVEVFRTRRMWWGKDLCPGDARGIWAAGGLEKG